MKRYFVRFSTGPYDGPQEVELDDLSAVERLLTSHAENSQFEFDVIYGERIAFEPATVVKAYRASKR